MMKSYKTMECRRRRDRIAAAARAIALPAGFNVICDNSRISASAYITISDGLDTEIKIRCSDHDDVNGDGSAWQVWDNSDIPTVIARLAARLGVEVPAGYRAEDFDKRRKAAREAVGARRYNAHVIHKERVQKVAAELISRGGHRSAVAAGKLCDEFYPDIPRAHRQAVAWAASEEAKNVIHDTR